MKLETAKSFALVVLVGVSLLLTFGLWTYQPNQTPVGGPGLLKEIDIGGMKETKKSLIEPINVIFHTNGSHFGYDEPEKRQGFYNELQSTVLYDFRAGEKKVIFNHMTSRWSIQMISLWKFCHIYFLSKTI